MAFSNAVKLTFVALAVLQATATREWSSLGGAGGQGGLLRGGNTARYPVPLHILRMTDKLFVQKWLDIATQEITKNGTVPYDSACDDYFGMKYLEKWQAARKEVCKPGGLSTYECYQHPPHNRQGAQNVGSLVSGPCTYLAVTAARVCCRRIGSLDMLYGHRPLGRSHGGSR